MVRASTEPPLEAKEEADFVKDLKKSGHPFKIRKMNGLGNRDWPDRMVLGPRKFIVFVELKRKKYGKLSPGQTSMLEDLSTMDFICLTSDDGHDAARWVIDQYAKHLIKIGKK